MRRWARYEHRHRPARRTRRHLPRGAGRRPAWSGHLRVLLDHRAAPPPPATRPDRPLATAVSEPAASSPRSTSSSPRHDRLVIDLTCSAADAAHADEIVDAIRAVAGVDGPQGERPRSCCTSAARSRSSPRCRCGTATTCRWPTPRASAGLHGHRREPGGRPRLTIKGNTVAVVTDGCAVLGLGNIGPGAAMPVMEGKAALFKRFADIDAWPICLDTQDVDEIVAHGRAHRARLRRHQPRGHRRPPLLRGRGPAAGAARHPGVPRRPARHGDRGRSPRCATRCGSWASTIADVRSSSPAAAPPGRRSSPAARRRAPAGRSCGTARASSARRRPAGRRQAGAGQADQPRVRPGELQRRPAPAPTSSSASARPTSSPSRTSPR